MPVTVETCYVVRVKRVKCRLICDAIAAIRNTIQRNPQMAEASSWDTSAKTKAAIETP